MVSGQLSFGVVCYAIINETTGEASAKSGSADHSKNYAAFTIIFPCKLMHYVLPSYLTQFCLQVLNQCNTERLPGK